MAEFEVLAIPVEDSRDLQLGAGGAVAVAAAVGQKPAGLLVQLGVQLEVSRIFDWYGEDFKLGHRGIASLPAFLARYADQLADAPADRDRIRSLGVPVAFLDYDWKLNDAR